MGSSLTTASDKQYVGKSSLCHTIIQCSCILLSGKDDFLGAFTGQFSSIKEKGEVIQWFDLQGKEVKSGRILMSLMWLEATKDKTLLIGELSKNSRSTY